MFSKKPKPASPLDYPEVQPSHEYVTVAVIGVTNFSAKVNEYARHGWEMFGGSAAGTTHYAYMRRPVA